MGASDQGVPRRSVLRLGTAAAAAGGAAALIPAGAARADAAGSDSIADPGVVTWPTPTLNEAFGGFSVRPRSLERWLFSTSPIRHVVCVGDSTTSGDAGDYRYESGGHGIWPERLATALRSIAPPVGDGFRGLWRGMHTDIVTEWRHTGTWTRTTPSDPFDVLPFAEGYRSNGGSGATLTWNKPSTVTVAGFDLYWFNMAGAGNWQYRVDGGSWVNMGQALAPADNKLHKFFVARPVQSTVQIRAHNGSSACLAPIGGIGIYSANPTTTRGMVVHNLGAGGQLLANLVRTSKGDPLAWFDAVQSGPASLAFRPDLVIVLFSNDIKANDPTRWKNNLVKLVTRVGKYADVILMNVYEQSQRPPIMQATYRATTVSVAAEHRCAVLDLYSAFAAAGAKGWPAANSAGLMLDGYHPSQLGHNDIAARVWRLLRNFS